MPKYLEEVDLSVGCHYRCETYLGHELRLKYLGNGNFNREHGLDYLGDMVLTLDGDVRYVFERV